MADIVALVKDVRASGSVVAGVNHQPIQSSHAAIAVLIDKINELVALSTDHEARIAALEP